MREIRTGRRNKTEEVNLREKKNAELWKKVRRRLGNSKGTKRTNREREWRGYVTRERRRMRIWQNLGRGQMKSRERDERYGDVRKMKTSENRRKIGERG